MDRASVPAPAQAAVVFQDGLGERRRTTDPTGTEALEVLCLRDELTSVPSFEFALRERVSRLANFRHAYFARVRSVDRLNDPVSTLAVVSDQTPGIRLSQILEVVERKGLTLEINASLCLLRQLVPAVATLHEHARDVAHGAIGPERIIVSPNARVIVTEYVLGAALEQLRYSHERYWKDLHVAVPRSAGQPKFDHRADALQLGLVALALVLGRPLLEQEYPTKIGEVVASAWAISARGGFEPLPAGLRAWLMRALQLDVRASFMSASDARAELEKLIGENDLLAAPITLETFLDQFRAAVTAAAPATPASVVRPPAAAAPPIPKPRPEAPRPPQPVASPPDPAPRRPAPSSEPFPVPSATLRVPSSAPATPAAPRVDPPPPVHSGRSPEPPLVKEPPRPAYEPRKDDQFEILSLASATTPVKTPRPPEYHKDYKEQKAAKDHKDPTRDIDTITSLWTAPTPAPMPAPTSFTTDQPRRRPRPLVIAFVVTALVVSGGLFASRMFVSDTAPAGNGTLILSTHPTGAQVVVDGQSRGITPLTLTLKAGAHVVQLRGAGQPRTIPVAIAADTQVSQYIELPGSGAAVGPGQLQVRTEPAGARVSVDGVPRGTAPITIGDIPPGEHHVVLSN